MRYSSKTCLAFTACDRGRFESNDRHGVESAGIPCCEADERIRAFLAADRRFRAVPRKNDRILRQREKFAVNRVAEIIETAVGKIGAADATGKQHISAEYLPRLDLAADKYDMPNRVARRSRARQFKAGGFKRVALP